MSPSLRTSSRSKRSLRSLSRATGMISRSANSRAVSRISRCSSVSSKSIIPRSRTLPVEAYTHREAGDSADQEHPVSIRTTKPALDEHAYMRDHVEHLLVDAHALPDLDLAARIDVLERTAAFLAEMLLPHAAAEQRVLYPEAAEILG